MGNDMVLDRLLTKAQANGSDDDWLINIAQKATSSDMLCRVVEKSAGTNVLLSVLNNEKANNDFLLNLIADKTTHGHVLSELLNKTIVIEDAYFKQMAKKLLAPEFDFTEEGTVLDGVNISELNLSIDKLRLKGLEFLEINEDVHGKYYEASKAACLLYLEIKQTSNDYAERKITKDQLQSIVVGLIDQYRTVLETHRGIKGILLSIVNAIVSGVNAMLGTKIRFFTLKTKTERIVDDIQQSAQMPIVCLNG